MHVILGRQAGTVVVTAVNVDTVGLGLSDLGPLRHLGQFGLLAEAAVVQVLGLGAANPAELLNAVVELVDVVVGVPDIGMPVAAGGVATGAPDGDLVLSEVGLALHDLLERTALPSDLVHSDIAIALMPAAAAHGVQGWLGEDDEGVMVAAVVHEVALGLLDALEGGGAPGEVESVGDVEAEQGVVEVLAGFHVGDVEAEVAKPTNLEGPVELDAADVIGALLGSCHWVFSSLRKGSGTNCCNVSARAGWGSTRDWQCDLAAQEQHLSWHNERIPILYP